MDEQMFRSVAFGGFHKLDVLNYIETSTAAHRAEVEGLRRELAELREASEDTEQRRLRAEGETVTVQARASDLESELAGSRADQEALRSELTALRAELAAAVAQAGKAVEENKSLLLRLEKDGPDAEAYRRLRSRAAGIELEARRRAQSVEEAALKQAEETREAVGNWVNGICRTYEQLRADLSASIAHAQDELERTRSSLGGVSDGFQLHDETMHMLLQIYRQEEEPAEQSDGGSESPEGWLAGGREGWE